MPDQYPRQVDSTQVIAIKNSCRGQRSWFTKTVITAIRTTEFHPKTTTGTSLEQLTLSLDEIQKLKTVEQEYVNPVEALSLSFPSANAVEVRKVESQCADSLEAIKKDFIENMGDRLEDRHRHRYSVPAPPTPPTAGTESKRTRATPRCSPSNAAKYKDD